MCGALGRAGFNVYSGVSDRRYFVGLPTPAAAGIVASVMLLLGNDEISRWPGGAIGAGTYIAALLMVSTIRYYRFKEIDFARRRTTGLPLLVEPGAQKMLQVVGKATGADFECEPALVSGSAIDATGEPLSDATLRLCEQSDAILFGAVGGPKWDKAPQERRPERGLLRLRKELDLFANLRPAKCFPMLLDASPLRREVVEGTDLMVIRELTGGLYFGEPRGREEFADGGARAVNTMAYTSREIERVARAAFDVAMKRRKRLAP